MTLFSYNFVAQWDLMSFHFYQTHLIGVDVMLLRSVLLHRGSKGFSRTGSWSAEYCTIAILTVYKQVFWYLNFANHRTKESFVSTANKPLVGTLMTIGDVTVSIAICRHRETGPDQLIWRCACIHFAQRIYLTNVQASGEERGSDVVPYADAS